MRVLVCIWFLILCLTPLGCRGLGKAAPGQPTANPRNPEFPAAPKDTFPAPPAPASDSSTPANVGGIVSGRVLTEGNPRATIYIITPSASGEGAPVIRTAETNEQGYFTILDLQPGQAYQLVARSKGSSYVQTGSLWVRPPEIRANIKLSTEFNPPNIPHLPPAAPGAGDPPARIESPTPLPPSAPPDGGTASPTPGADARTIPPLRPRLENIVTGPEEGHRRDPITNIAPPTWRPSPTVVPPITPRREEPTPPPVETSPRSELVPSSVTPVPSCQLVGKQLHNFALAGLDGQPWEYRRDRRGKVVLLDFWGTWCTACRVSIRKHLTELQALYGRSGLEIIGIAYEQDPRFEDQVARVQQMANQLGINYRILMGYGMARCPVNRQFGIRSYPTYVLLDDNGRIIWRSEGLDDAGYTWLKDIIRRELGIR